MNKTTLNLKTKTELLKIAEGLSLSGVQSLKKPALVDKILKAQASSKTEISPNIQELTPVNTGSSWGVNHASDQETVEDSKYYEGFIQHTFPQPEWTLPKKYDDTKVALLIRDPYWLHSYWEINSETASDVQNKLGHNMFASSHIALRIYDVTDIVFDGANANNYSDINVGEALSWYIHVPASNRSYCAEIGYKTPDGRFFAVARSNVIEAPRHGVSDILDEEWMAVEGKTFFDKMYALSGGYQAGASSGEFSGERKELLTQKLAGMLNLSSGEAVSSEINVSSPSGKQQAKPKDFWLVANTELIVYGATEPDASVTVCGQPVKLNKDGSFCLRFALPDGQQNIPIKATDKDGDQHRKIEFEVTRKQI
ncbi:MAG: DUF4912 domain-containing protein [Candidatus Margulisiibacteriota bacterium]